MADRGTNARSTLKIVQPPGVRTLRQARIADMAALEALPPAIRRYLNEHVIELGSWSVLQFYRSIARQAAELGGSAYDAEVHTLRKLAAIEAGDLDAFAEQYRARYGLALPHAAAGVSVLRYGPLERGGRVTARQALARRGPGRIPLPADIREAA